jgi:hypothetical protein
MATQGYQTGYPDNLAQSITPMDYTNPTKTQNVLEGFYPLFYTGLLDFQDFQDLYLKSYNYLPNTSLALTVALKVLALAIQPS